MAITASNIHFRKATTAGAAGNSTAPGAAGTSLGKYITNADITDATLNNLFDDVTGDQNAASQVDYQAMFVYNDHATLAWIAPTAWISAEVAGGTSCAFWWDSTAATTSVPTMRGHFVWQVQPTSATVLAFGDIQPASRAFDVGGVRDIRASDRLDFPLREPVDFHALPDVRGVGDIAV